MRRLRILTLGVRFQDKQMRVVDKFDLVSRIGRHLQEQMTYSDIDSYVSVFGVPLQTRSSSFNSKWIYVKELLNDQPVDLVIKIAEDLGLKHTLNASGKTQAVVSRFWTPGYFRLFISHLSADKVTAARFQQSLLKFGITSFVAHEDIKPTKEWQSEIESALGSMDAMAVILTPGFGDSDWTDQEVGFAMGRDVQIIPIKKGLNPYGFIGKYQAIQARNKTVAQVADGVFDALVSSNRTVERMAETIANRMLMDSHVGNAGSALELLSRFEKVPTRTLESIVQRAGEWSPFVEDPDIQEELKKLLQANGMENVAILGSEEKELDDDIPF